MIIIYLVFVKLDDIVEMDDTELYNVFVGRIRVDL